MNMQNILKQAQKMQMEMQKADKELKNKTYSSTAGGGAICVEAKGDNTVTKITIDEGICNAEDKEMLEDMLTIAVNDVFRQMTEDRETVMSKLTGGTKIPGAF